MALGRPSLIAAVRIGIGQAHAAAALALAHHVADHGDPAIGLRFEDVVEVAADLGPFDGGEVLGADLEPGDRWEIRREQARRRVSAT